MTLLDTHVVIWMMTAPDRISRPAAEMIARAGAEGGRLRVSAASVFELFYAKRRNRVHFNVSDQLLMARLRGWFDFFPITEAIAAEAAAFPDSFHGDPMDRMIVATAMVEDCTLLTADSRIHASGACKVLW
jgi:PIN domain nuclease of toxin-antitoxin system